MYHVPSMHVVYMAVRIQFVALECYEYFILFYFIFNKYGIKGSEMH